MPENPTIAFAAYAEKSAGQMAFEKNIAETHKGALQVYPKYPEWRELSTRRKREWEIAAKKNQLPKPDDEWLKKQLINQDN